MNISAQVWHCHPEELTPRQRRLALEYIALRMIESEEDAAARHAA